MALIDKVAGKVLSKQALKGAFKAAKTEGKQWFRYEVEPWARLNRKGWEASAISSYIEPKGQYFALHPKDLDPLVNPHTRQRSFGVRDLLRTRSRNRGDWPSQAGGIIRAIPAEGANIAKFNQKEWEQFLIDITKGTHYESSMRHFLGQGQGHLESAAYDPRFMRGIDDLITESLKKQGYTHVQFPDIAARQEHIDQVVSLVPKRTIGHYKGKYKWLGLGAGVGASAMLGGEQDEAKASPGLSIVKGAAKVGRSEAFKQMLGRLPYAKKAWEQYAKTPLKGDVKTAIKATDLLKESPLVDKVHVAPDRFGYFTNLIYSTKKAPKDIHPMLGQKMEKDLEKIASDVYTGHGLIPRSEEYLNMPGAKRMKYEHDRLESLRPKTPPVGPDAEMMQYMKEAPERWQSHLRTQDIPSGKDKSKWLRLAGLSAGAGAAAMLGGAQDQDKTYAMMPPGPRGKFYREILKIAKGAMVPFKREAYEKGVREVEEDAVKRANMFHHYKDYSLDYPKTLEAAKVLKRTKGDLREIQQEAFTPERITSVEPYQTWKQAAGPDEAAPFDPVIGLYDPMGKRMWFEKNALIKHEGSSKKPTVPHEVYHAIQGEERIYPKDKEGVYKYKGEGHLAYREGIENEARQFAEIVRQRSLSRQRKLDVYGRADTVDSLEDIPPKYSKWLVPGAVGAVGAGTLLTSDNAEAGTGERIFGEMIEAGAKKLRGKSSSTAGLLLGKPFKGGTIMDVLKGPGEKRYIVLDNDAVYPTTKQVVADLARHHGTENYLRNFELQPDRESQVLQARKSLKYHLERGNPDKEAVLDYHRAYAEQLRTMEVKVPNLSLVESDGVFFTMPRDYVDLLVTDGAPIKIWEKLIK